MGRNLARSIHHCREHVMSALLRTGVFKAALARRRLPSRVELGTPVLLSADTSPAQSSQEDQNQPGSSHSYSSGLGREIMVSRTLGHEHLSSDQAATLGGSSVVVTGEGPAPKPTHAPPSCVEIERQQLNAFDLPPEICDVILQSGIPQPKLYTSVVGKSLWLGAHQNRLILFLPPYLRCCCLPCP